MTTYAIVSGPTPQHVADGVNGVMKQGYKLVGGIAAVVIEPKNPLEIGSMPKVLFMQSMTKEDTPEEAALKEEVRKVIHAEGHPR